MTRFERAGVWAGIVGAIAAVIPLLPIVFPLAPPVPPPAPPPQIPNYSTGWIEGQGKDTAHYCNPRKAALEKQYSDFRIEMMMLPEQHEDNRNMVSIKHDKYMYQCSFSAHLK